jgi:uracil-DNA glycosylase family 4
VPPATDRDDVSRQLESLRREVEQCTRCRLHETRTRAVFGEGDPQSQLMFVGEAPGYHEDQQGRPFVGAAGKLLGELLASIGLERKQVFIANVLKSRPPNNRDPQPDEIAACEPWLWQQIAIIQPSVICSLGNFATKLLSGEQTGITRVHGRAQLRVLGGQPVYLFPIFHPAAALYTPAMLATLKQDFVRLPELLAAPPAGWRTGGESSEAGDLPPYQPAQLPDAQAPGRPAPVFHPLARDEAGSGAASPADEQLGLF